MRRTVMVLLGCSSLHCGPQIEPEAEALPCAIARIVAERCQECHSATPVAGAPMALVSAADFRAPAKSDPSRSVGQLVLERLANDHDPMPPTPRPRVEGAELATLTAWIESGAPKGEACDGPLPDGGSPLTPLSCDPDVHSMPASPYEIPAGGSDLVVCYGFSLNASSKRHLTGFAPRVDNAVVLHHMSLLQADEAFSTTPVPCPDSGGMASWRVVYGWAPGADAFELPKEAGFAADPGAHFVVQLHYVNSSATAQSDSSGFSLCSDSELRNFDADIMAFGTHEFTIPPHGSESVTCNVAVPPTGATTRLFAAFPHMHRLGTSISTRAFPAGGGSAVDIGSVAQWSFDYQSWQSIDYVLSPGDVVRTKCAWNNPYSHGVGFGPGTDDEMCYSFVMYFPRIEDPAWHWVLPALYSECEP